MCGLHASKPTRRSWGWVRGQGGKRKKLTYYVLVLFTFFLVYDSCSKLALLASNEVLQSRARTQVLVRRQEVIQERQRRREERERDRDSDSDRGRAETLQGRSVAGGNSRNEKAQLSLQQRRAKWMSMDVPQASELPAYAREWDVKDIFLHQGNYKRLLKHYVSDGEGEGGGEEETGKSGELGIKNSRSFPDSKLAILRRYNFESCAIVGNSGSMLNYTYGKSIDSHEVVLRFNQAPPGTSKDTLARHVGSKTTFRLINTRWTNKYADTHFLEQGLPLESAVTLIVTRASPRAYDTIAETLKKFRPDVKLLYLSSRVISAARQLLVQYRAKLEEEGSGFGKMVGGNTPSSGFVGIYTMMTLCQNVTIYGFGLDNSAGKSQEYHYFHILSPEHTMKKNTMNPTHSFDTEKLLLRSMHSEGRLTFCSSGQPSCGLQVQKKRKNQVEADAFNLDFI